MEFWDTIYLSYIYLANSPCYTNLAYSKEYTYYIMSIYSIMLQLIPYIL